MANSPFTVIGSGGGGGGAVDSVFGVPDRITTTAAPNIVVDIAPTYIGQGSITTLGTLIAGVWNASPIDLAAYVTGNLPVVNLGGGAGASPTTFWRGDGTWAVPSASAAGAIIQTVSASLIPEVLTTSLTYVDVPGAAISITPISITSKILVMFTWQLHATFQPTFNTIAYAQILRDAVNISAPDAFITFAVAGGVGIGSQSGQAFTILDTPGVITPVTYKLQQKIQVVPAGTANVGSSKVFMTLMEISG